MRVVGLGLIGAMLVFTAACGVIGQLTGGSSTVAGALWPDVPPFTGAKKTDIDLPLPIKLAVQGYVKSASKDTGSLDYIVFTTEKPAAEVGGFYTAQRMAAAGWNAPEHPGRCTSNNAVAPGGVICFFGRRDGARETILMIVTARDDAGGQTQVYYVRMSVTGTPTP